MAVLYKYKINNFFTILIVLLTLFIIYLAIFSNGASNNSETNYEIINKNSKINTTNKNISELERISESVLTIINCHNRPRLKTVRQKGKFWAFYNYVQSEKQFNCAESITYTTPASYRFLDNLPALVKIWQGPISVALYAPGNDFYATLESIAYLRNCGTELIRDFVTFHIFFEDNHFPSKHAKPLIQTYDDKYDCMIPPPFTNGTSQDTYKAQNNLPFPINVARNIARETAQTHFIFPSDIELFPIENFIPKFLQMVVNKKDFFTPNMKPTKVFVLPIFEILHDQQIPKTKTKLQEMIKEETAILFHASICKTCHKVIKGDQWLKSRETEGLDMFAVGKRQKQQIVWEPFYVGTNQEPLFDERLTWEGQFNKMTQAYSLCLLDYDFVILDNAFLIHKPGIKKKKVQIEKHKDMVDKTKEILVGIRDELIQLYGNNTKCLMGYHLGN